ncbi:terminase large subunit domain-containing protein [Mycolicibacterium fortuitum]|uniref:terminase large subunit domain-containing protein n=1 Tax=Mycolicibacterium fortuitum TaxID=1766 RepID=UPI0009423572|nr:terminase family protein [Mycolicibacterium fortuitum]
MTADHLATLTAAGVLATRRARRRPTSPAELATMLIPGYHVTPTIQLISDELARAVEEPNARVVLTTPPRTGKSVLVSQVLPVWALMRNPDTEVIVKSYGDDLAEEHSAAARRLVADNPELVGISLAADKKAVGRWRVEGHRGGMLAGGILSSATGFGSDLLIVDDPVKGAQEADSAAYRRRLVNEFRASLLTRLMPGGSAIVVLTRWHEDDIAGSLLAEPGSRWVHINIPAVSTAGVPDALERERTGTAMVSAIGRTAEDFAEIRRGVGERVWAAMYLGVPSTPEGGLIKSAWLDTWRLPVAPAGAVKVVVGVDPADSGQGDETGIVAASLAADGTVSVIADASDRLTSDEWATRAVRLALDVGASEISVEAFAAGTTYVRVVKEALARAKPDRYIAVTPWPPRGSGRGKGDSVARAAALLQALEVGTCRLAGHHPEWEQQAVQWQSGQHQPDRVAALVVAHDVLAHAAGAQVNLVTPITGRLGQRGGSTVIAGTGGGGQVRPLNPWARNVNRRSS